MLIRIESRDSTHDAIGTNQEFRRTIWGRNLQASDLNSGKFRRHRPQFGQNHKPALTTKRNSRLIDLIRTKDNTGSAIFVRKTTCRKTKLQRIHSYFNKQGSIVWKIPFLSPRICTPSYFWRQNIKPEGFCRKLGRFSNKTEQYKRRSTNLRIQFITLFTRSHCRWSLNSPLNSSGKKCHSSTYKQLYAIRA